MRAWKADTLGAHHARRAWAVAAAGVVLLLGISAAMAVQEPPLTLSILLILPIALVSSEFGLRWGLGAAVASIAAMAMIVPVGDGAYGWSFVLSRALVFVIVAGMMGWLADRRREDIAIARAVIDSIPTPAFVIDHAGQYILVNAAAGAVTQRPPASMLGQSVGHLQDSRTAARVQDHVLEVLRTGRRARFEIELQTPGAGARTFVMDMGPIRSATTSPIGVVLVATDISERIEHARAVVEASENEREEYERAVRDYSQLMRHRLANPVTIIEGAVATLQSDYADDPAHRHQLARMIAAAVERIRRLDTAARPRAREEDLLEPLPRLDDAPSSRSIMDGWSDG